MRCIYPGMGIQAMLGFQYSSDVGIAPVLGPWWGFVSQRGIPKLAKIKAAPELFGFLGWISKLPSVERGMICEVFTRIKLCALCSSGSKRK